MSIATEITRLQTAKASLKAAIEAKGVTVASDAKLDAYPALVDSIPSGGGGGGSSEKLLNFYDYEGTLVASFAASEIAGLASLPDAPDHSTDTVPLTFDGWNWTLAQIQAYHTDYPDAVIKVGANYHTTDGKTHAFFNITTDKDGNGVWFDAQESGTVDWGDGSAAESFSAGGAYHVYTNAGLFHCVIDSPSKFISFGHNDSSYGKYILKIQSVCYSNSVTSIGGYAFSNCYALQSITIPSSVTSIGGYAFSNCCSLQSITIPSSVTSIGGRAFQSCSVLQRVTIPSSVTSIENSVFGGCSTLRSITIPSSVTNIASNVFQNCYALQSITIPSSVKSIGSNVFYACYTLQSITIPDGVTSIGGTVFQNCSSLYTVTLEPTTPPTLSNSNAFNTNNQKRIIVPAGTLAAYQAATNWSTFASIMEEAAA